MHKLKISIILIVLFFFNITSLKSEDASIHKKIDKLILNGDYKKAEEAANSAYEKNPNDIETICAKACVYRNMAYKNGIQIDSAKLGIKEFQSGSAELSPEIIKEAFKDIYYYDKEIFSKAEPLYFKIIELDKNYLNAYFNLLNTYMVMEDFEKYFKVIDMFIQNQKTNDNCKAILLDLASKLYKQESFKHAERLYLEILKNYPDYTYAKSDLGAVYSSIGEIEKAASLFQDVYQKDPTDIINTSNLNKIYITQEKFKEAFKVNLTILKLKESDYFNYFYAGQLAYITGENYSHYFNKFIEKRKAQMNNNSKDFYIEVSKKYLELSKLPDQDKLDFLDQILIQYYENKYNYDSIVTANTILKIKTEKNPLIILAAIYDNKIYYPQKSLTYLNKIQEYSKTDQTIMKKYNLNYNYGRTYYNLKQYNDAIRYFKKNIEEKKDDANVLYAIGKAYEEKKDTENACKYFTKCSELNNKEQMHSINASIRKTVFLGCNKNKK